ncbi:hypothetical protein RYX36_008044 [Vicia faba]
MGSSGKFVNSELVDTIAIAKLSYQKLHPKFARVLRCQDYEVVTLCSDNGRTQMLLVLNIEDSHRTKLGYEWDEFCKSNLFRGGDRIRFRLDVRDANKTCHVYKVH